MSKGSRVLGLKPNLIVMNGWRWWPTPRPGPRDRQVVREHDRKVDDVLLPGRVDQPLGQRVADDGEGASFAVGAARVLGAQDAVERARWQAAPQGR